MRVWIIRLLRLVAMAGIAPIGTTGAALADDDFTLTPRGRIYVDWASVHESYPGRANHYVDTGFRTARLGVNGRYGPKWRFVAEFDFAHGATPIARDVKVSTALATRWRLVLGNQKPPNSMEELISLDRMSFMKRAAITDVVGLKRQFGMAVQRRGRNGSFSAGVYTDNLADAIRNGQSLITGETILAARATHALINEPQRKLHVGVSFRQRNLSEGDVIRFRARPDAQMASRNFSVGSQGETGTLYGLEAAFVQGPFYLQAEYMHENAVNTATGGYVQAGWYLTGEQRSYSAGSGTFGRTKPLNPVTGKGGYGAVELAARHDWSRVNGTMGGDMQNWTIGVNWYPIANARLMANVVVSNVDGAAAVFGAGDTTTFQVRGQFSF